MIMASKDYCYEKEISDEQELTFKRFYQICDDNNIDHDKRHLKSMGIVNKDGYFTNLALLLSDQSPIEA